VAEELPRTIISVEDRILLHLLEQDEQADRYIVTTSLTRPGIAESCALHPPNVSRTMRKLTKEGLVSEHTRTIVGDDRRQKTWQLTEKGRIDTNARLDSLANQAVLIRDKSGTLLEIPASSAAERLDAELTLLQILMHAQHEGLLTYGDIRFGLIHSKGTDNTPPPGRITMLSGAHATYHTQPPHTRTVHGRTNQIETLDNWFSSGEPCIVVQGIAGIGKSTLCSNWLSIQMEKNPYLSVCWYPCQPWDKELGLSVSLLHRFGVEENHDPYNLMDALPLSPGSDLDIDSLRRRLLAYMTDALAVRERFEKGDDSTRPPPYWLIVLDDIHHLKGNANNLLGALLQVADQSPLRLLCISRTELDFYDRRDVHTRARVSEMHLSGLSVEELSQWIGVLDAENIPSAKEVHESTGGHPLAMELMEIYGQVTHGDWLRFLDEEIFSVLPENERELLSTLAVAERPLKWKKLAKASGWEGTPPERLIEHGLILELESGFWLHEALRDRLLREVGTVQKSRKEKLNKS